jgi:hypothetical protein
MNVHLDLHGTHFLEKAAILSCTEQMHVHPGAARTNVHPVLHLHGVSGTI